MLESLLDFLTPDKFFDYNYQLLQAICALNIVLLLNLKSKKYGKWTLVLHFLGVFLAMDAISLVLCVLLPDFTGRQFISIALILVLYALFAKNYDLKCTCVLCCIFYSMQMCIIVLIGTLRSAITLVGGSLEFEGVIRIFLTASTVLVPFLINAFDIKKICANKDNNYIVILLYNLFTILVALVGNLLQSGFTASNAIFAMVVYIGSIVMNYVAYCLIYKVSLSNAMNMQLLADKYVAISNAETLKITQRNLEDLRKIRHDIKNHYSIMRGLLTEQRYDELDKYLIEYDDDIYPLISTIDCGNSIVNSIINLEIAKARASDIPLDAKLMVPNKLNIKDSDISSLLTNLLDNAIEGTVRYGLNDPISFSMIQKADGFLYISVVNGVGDANKEEVFGSRTSKDNGILHGYGTKIIKQIVRDYNGEMFRVVENGKVVVDIMLDTVNIKEN